MGLVLPSGTDRSGYWLFRAMVVKLGRKEVCRTGKTTRFRRSQPPTSWNGRDPVGPIAQIA
jgi:hypothetical protein